LRLEVVLDCVVPEAGQFRTVISFGGAVPLRSNLTLEVEGSLEDAAAGVYSLRATFSDAGRASGNVSLQHVSYDLDGTIFTCKDVAVPWSASQLGA
jgi:hypothetical protein